MSKRNWTEKNRVGINVTMVVVVDILPVFTFLGTTFDLSIGGKLRISLEIILNFSAS